MERPQRFRDYFGVQLAQQLGQRIQTVYPQFLGDVFVQRVAASVEPLELKDRVALIAAALRETLPAEYLAALDILCAILGPENPQETGMFDFGYQLMPIAYFVEVYGLEHVDASLQAIHAITRRFTGEFAIRPFLVQHPERTMEVLQTWVHDDNTHVRRLVSEGTRPRLPWAARLQMAIDNPEPMIALLEQLKDDPSPYVRKSVANHLNDITKDHPQRVLLLLTDWQVDASQQRQWIIRHALRGLIKQGHADALRLIAADHPLVELEALSLEPLAIQLGDTLTLTATLVSRAEQAQKLVVDYCIHLVRAQGKTQPKVFKLKTLMLATGERVTLCKRHALKPVTTRRYYAGQHRLELQVNGVVLGETAFLLEL
ncbi:MAG: DNA alkylation repair protein [Chloroflexaceae bacterium]|nr:DNA alkylation repair protein [Chloroflexaceae bacterium]